MFPGEYAVVRLGVLALAVAGGGCAGSIKKLRVYPGVAEIPPDAPGYADTLQIKYLGVGGFLMRRGPDVILTAPFYSNPGFVRVGLRFPIWSRTNRIDKLLPDVRTVPAILAGHSHYDHLLDLPFIANVRAPRASLYGNRTMVNILSSVVSPERLHALDFEAGELRRGGRTGAWQRVGDYIRFMAFRSEHAPHYRGIKLFKGEVAAPLKRLPRTAYGWKEGQTLAFVIDFLKDDGSIHYRVFYHDAAVNCPRYGGWPDFPAGEQRSPDVDILCMASYQFVANYPDYIVTNHLPANIIVGHWEDFSRSPARGPKVVPLTDGPRFMKRLEACNFPTNRTFLPQPGAWMRFSEQ